ncbi:hypothetical protein Hanom_Chr15g01365671 [Helianthus anomalus]
MMEFVRSGGGEKVVGLRGWKMRVDRGGLCGGGAKERRRRGTVDIVGGGLVAGSRRYGGMELGVLERKR